MSLLMTRLFLALVLKPRPARKERGDVPGLMARISHLLMQPA